MFRLLHLPRPDPDTLHRILTARMSDLPPWYNNLSLQY